MARFGNLPRRERPLFPKSARSVAPDALDLLKDEQGSSLLEFAIVVPLLVVFVVGIYDFSGAFNQKQKIGQAAQEGAIVAGSQPMDDLFATSNSNPTSLQTVATAVFNSLTGSGVLATGACSAPGTASGPTGLAWTYTISNCNSAFPSDNLVITINRGWVCGASPPPCPSGPPIAVGTSVTVTYPYRWRLFGSVIQLLFPGPNGYSTPTQVTDSATVHNQL